VDAIFKTITATIGGVEYLLISSAPTAEWQTRKGAIAQLENTFRVEARSTTGGGGVPEGFKVVSRSGNIGQALAANLSGAQPARAAFKTVFQQISTYLDGPPKLQGAYGDRNNQEVQAFFRGSYQGSRVTGMIMVAVAGGSGRAAAIFDQDAQFSRSFPVLSRGLVRETTPAAGGGGGGMGQPLALTRTTFPDGSGVIGLPAGWKIDSSWKGIVDASGPQGQKVVFGYYQQVFVNLIGPPPKLQGFIHGPYRDPAGALGLYVDSLTNHAVSQRRATFRVIEQMPVQAQNGRAAYITYEIQMDGKTVRGFAMVNTSPIDQTNWLYYMSAIATPAARFSQDFPTMWAMWKSWSVNPAVFRERMDAALKSMRETSRLIQETNANTQRTYDRTNLAWDQTIRGVTTIEDTVTRRRGDVNTQYVDEVVGVLNQNGYNYRIVPLPELIP
jgi:hypothetical protein